MRTIKIIFIFDFLINMSRYIKKILLLTAAAVILVIAFNWERVGRLVSLLKYSYSFEFDAFTEGYNRDYIFPGQQKIDVKKYDIDLSLDLEGEEISAKEKIFFSTNAALSQAVFNFYENMKINEIKLNGNYVQYNRDDRHIFIEHKLLKDSSYVLSVSYSGSPKKKGLGSFNFDEVENGKVVYSINEPYYASTWFMCNDKPDDKAKYSISIENDSLYTSVSVGNLDSIVTTGMRKRYYWSTGYNIPTYAVAFYSGMFDKYENSINLNGKKIPLKIYGYNLGEQSVAQVEQTVSKAIVTFSQIFGNFPFENDKVGIVQIPWAFGGIENYSAIGIGESYFSPMGLFNDIFVHEIAHYWWGNSVTPEEWSEIWLNESFASYSEVLFDEFNYGKESAAATLIGKRFEDYEVPLNNPGREALSSLTYNNGTWVLHLLRNEVGDSAFFEIMREYSNKYIYSNGSTKLFERICEEVYGGDLSYFFNRFVYHESGFPEISIVLKQDNTLLIKQSGADAVKLKLHLKLWKEGKILVSFSPVIEREEQSFSLSKFGNVDSVSADNFRLMPHQPNVILEEHFN